MSDNAALIQQSFVQNNSIPKTMQLRREAAQLFRNGRIIALWHRFWGHITQHDVSLKNLNDLKSTTPLQIRQQAGIQEIPINQIKGSVGRSRDFDHLFRPLKTHNKDRWVNVAVARRMGVPLPAVNLIQIGDRFFVRDGHHRISVARSMGQATIDASVIVWKTVK
ncbi:MAG: hypothetical protein DWQ04_02000 [Chloroflexi bacterium]|nr:MAG: hypothetical protein DWQ04_02000 [Chloroflexota bacterium]